MNNTKFRKFYFKLQISKQTNNLLKFPRYSNFSTSIINRKEFSQKLDNIFEKMCEVIVKNDDKNTVRYSMKI